MRLFMMIIVKEGQGDFSSLKSSNIHELLSTSHLVNRTQQNTIILLI